MIKLTMSQLHEESTFRLQYLLLAAAASFVLGFVGMIGLLSASTAQAQDTSQISPAQTAYFSDAKEQDYIAPNKEWAEFAQADTSSGVSQEEDTNQCRLLTDSLRIDTRNNSRQVYRLQAFLKAYRYNFVELTGTFDLSTLKAVQKFQVRHSDEVLAPWGYQPDEATGYVHITTRQKINEIYCGQNFSLSRSQRAEIDRFKQKLARLRQQGISFDTANYLQQYAARSGVSQRTLARLDAEVDNTKLAAGSKAGQAEKGDDQKADQTAQKDDQAATGGPATSSRGFFARLFGTGSKTSDSGDAETPTTTEKNNSSQTATGSDQQADNQATSTTGGQATDTATGVDQVATSVYGGVNAVVDFVLSPTFLLILLAVLVLLLIATLLEDEEGGGGQKLGADLSTDVTDGDGEPDTNTDEDAAERSSSDDDKDDSDDASNHEETTGQQDDGLAENDPEDDVITFDANGNNDENTDEENSQSGGETPTDDLFGDSDRQ